MGREQPGLCRFQSLDIAVVVIQHRAGCFHVAVSGEGQCEVHAVGFCLRLKLLILGLEGFATGLEFLAFLASRLQSNLEFRDALVCFGNRVSRCAISAA